MTAPSRIVLSRTTDPTHPWAWRIVTDTAVLGSGYAPSREDASARAIRARRLAMGETTR